MIKLVRVDHRLLHGQVAMAWTQSLDVDCMLIANDAILKDDIRIATLKRPKPHAVKLGTTNLHYYITALNSGVTDKYKLFIVVESIEDAHRLAVSCRNIREINLGGLKPREEAVKKLYKTIPVSAQDEVLLRELIEAGTRIEIRQVPGDAKIEVKEII